MNRTILWTTLVLLFFVFAPTTNAQQSTENKWEPEIQQFEDSDKKVPPPRGAVLFVGSSSIRMWKSLAEDFPGIKVINRGFGGSEIADSTYYVDRIVTPYLPGMIVFYAGDNDLSNGKTPQQVLDNYKAFVSRVRIKLPTTEIAFISIKPSPARVSIIDQMRQANALIRTYSSHDKNLLFIDVFTPMLGKDGNPRPELFGPDKLHMNREGYDLWKSVVAPYFSPIRPLKLSSH
jgi:lysophospholipase L1-like esterase